MGHHTSRRKPRGGILHPLKIWKQSLGVEFPMLEINWVDSEGDDDWQDITKFKPRTSKLEVQTIGYLLDDNHTNLVIARSITKDETPLIEGVFSIPKCSIIKIKHLSKGV